MFRLKCVLNSAKDVLQIGPGALGRDSVSDVSEKMLGDSSKGHDLQRARKRTISWTSSEIVSNESLLYISIHSA